MENTEIKETKKSLRKEIHRAEKYREITAESCTDYVLPDYNEDVRKIIFTGAKINPSGAFPDGDEIVFSGVVDYNVVYSDADGEVRSLDFSSDYEYSVKCDTDKYVDAYSKTGVASVYLRPVGPRKLTVRCGIVGEVGLTTRDTVETCGSAFDEGTPEVLTENVMIHGRRLSEVCEREYAEILTESDEVNADDVSVLLADADAVITDVRAVEGGAQLVGEINICAVIKNGDEPPFTACKTIPIDETVAFDEAIDGECTLRGVATPVSLSVTVNPEDVGNNITANVVVELRCVCDYNMQTELITDSYLKECVVENTYEDLSYTSLVSGGMEVINTEAELDRESASVNEVREILYLDAVAKTEKTNIVDGMLHIAGELRFSGIGNMLSQGGEASSVSVKFSTPFDVKVNNSCQINDNNCIYTDVSVGNIKAELDANKVYVSCQIRVEYLVTDVKKVRYLATSGMREDLPFARASSVITLYYPDSSESLFSVAKRFHTTVREIAQANSLTESAVSMYGKKESLTGIKRLMIR